MWCVGVSKCEYMSMCDVVCMCVYVCTVCGVCMCVYHVCVRLCPLVLVVAMFHDFAYHQGLFNFCENS